LSENVSGNQNLDIGSKVSASPGGAANHDAAGFLVSVSTVYVVSVVRAD
jgi:hypothetical protein